MNTPETLSIDVQEQIDWLQQHKVDTQFSWSMIAQQVGIPVGTLTAWAGGKYQGDNKRIADSVFRYRQHLASQAQLEIEAPRIPGYFETPTSRRLQTMLTWAHRGVIIAAAMGPGTGKTMSAENYRDAVSNAWLVTMKPSTAGVNNMLIATLKSLGDKNARGTSQALSDRVSDRVRNANGLIIFDEAQHLSERSIDEIRSWHDETGVGIALLGNETVVSRLEGGSSRRASFAQIYSRVAMRHTQNLPSKADAECLCDAWNVDDAKLRKFIVDKARMAGGLRGVTHMLVAAKMISAGEGEQLNLSHLQEAWRSASRAGLRTRAVASLHRIVSVALGHDPGGRPMTAASLAAAVLISAFAAAGAIAVFLSLEPLS